MIVGTRNLTICNVDCTYIVPKCDIMPAVEARISILPNASVMT